MSHIFINSTTARSIKFYYKKIRFLLKKVLGNRFRKSFIIKMKKFPFTLSLDHTSRIGKRIGVCISNFVDESEPEELLQCNGVYKVFDHSKRYCAKEVAK
jgi:hypothetical protein